MVAVDNTYSENAREPEPRKRAFGLTGKSLISGAILLSSAAFGATVPAVLPVDLNQTYSASAEYSFKSATSSTINLGSQAQDLLAQPETLDAIAKQLDWGLIGATGDSSQTSLNFLNELMTGREMTLGRSEAAQRVRLAAMLAIVPAGNLNSVQIAATAQNAQFAADAANAAAAQLAAMSAGTASSGEHPQIELARKALEQAQIALDNSGVSDDAVRAERQIGIERDALSADVERLQTHLESLTRQSETLLKMKFADVLTQVLPEEMALSGLETVRRRFLDAQLNVDQLSAELGPRHPRFLAAKAAADEGRAAVAKALSAIVADIGRQKAQAARELDGLKTKLATLQNRAVPEEVSRRLELEKTLETARKDYLETLRQTNASASSAIKAEQTRIASANDVATHGLPHWIYTLLGALAGLCLGGACLPARLHSQASQDDEDPVFDLPVLVNEETVEQPTIMPPMVQVQASVKTLQQLDEVINGFIQDELERASVSPLHFDDYYREDIQSVAPVDDWYEPEQDIDDNEDDQPQELAANDDRSLAWLTDLIVANKIAQSTGEPLPYLLANIMQGRSTAGQSVQVQAEDTDAELQELLGELEVLRQELAQHEADNREQRFALAS